MSEKLDFVKRLKSRLPQIEKESLYLKLLEATLENQQLQELCRDLEEGVVITDAKGHPVLINSKATDWLGGVHASAKQPLWNLTQDPSFAAFLKENVVTAKVRTVHDVKVLSPKEALNAITIHLELLKKRLAGLPDDKRKAIADSLSDIQDETRRLDRIIRNFLKATRKPPLRLRLDDLNEVISEAFSFLKPQMDVAKISVKFSKEKGIPSFLMDRERLYYAFMNLLKNALEAMPQGGLLKIAVTRKQRCAIVTIADSGCGIDEKDLGRIFDIYYTSKPEGAGLGLMMVYDAIAEHGGKIEVASKLSKGTTFKILLPIREPQLQLPNYKETDRHV